MTYIIWIQKTISTKDVIASVIDNVIENLLDPLKASDCVEHKVLLDKIYISMEFVVCGTPHSLKSNLISRM